MTAMAGFNNLLDRCGHCGAILCVLRSFSLNVIVVVVVVVVGKLAFSTSASIPSRTVDRNKMREVGQ